MLRIPDFPVVRRDGAFERILPPCMGFFRGPEGLRDVGNAFDKRRFVFEVNAPAGWNMLVHCYLLLVLIELGTRRRVGDEVCPTGPGGYDAPFSPLASAPSPTSSRL